VDSFIDIFLPKVCLGCKTEGFFVCTECIEEISEYKYLVCPICKKRSIDGRIDKSCRSESGLTRFMGSPLSHSDKSVKKIIHAFKYQHAKEIASPLSEILIEFLNKNNFGKIISEYKSRVIFVPVPLYNFRERERGFNQAIEIGNYLSEYYKIPLEEKVLIKHKNTEPQADVKNKEEREKNIAGAFSINPTGSDPVGLIENKIVILIDDVYTSGATMRECALTLRSAGAAEVWGITVIRE